MCVCQLEGTISGSSKTPHKISLNSPHKPRGQGMESNYSCGRNGEPYQQGELSGEEWKTNGFYAKRDGVFKCIAGIAADCTAVCCCPLSLLHLLTFACIKLPSIVVIRALRKVKTKLRRKQKCQDANEDDIDPRTPFTPCFSCPESTSDISWAPFSGIRWSSDVAGVFWCWRNQPCGSLENFVLHSVPVFYTEQNIDICQRVSLHSSTASWWNLR